MDYYRTFKRSARNWQEFSSARKMTEERGLTYTQASERCKQFNANLTPRQRARGTKLEFERR